jgi:hypothetical protein
LLLFGALVFVFDLGSHRVLYTVLNEPVRKDEASVVAATWQVREPAMVEHRIRVVEGKRAMGFARIAAERNWGGQNAIHFMVIGVDPCDPWRTPLPMSGHRSAAVGHWYREVSANGDDGLWRAGGCESGKIKLLREVRYVTDFQEGLAVLRRGGGDDLGVIDARDRAPAAPEVAASRGDYQVREFSSNAVVLDVDIRGDSSMWLLYADAYDPSIWRAVLDGTEVPIARGNLAFKAVSVPPGTHRVELRVRRDSRWLFPRLHAVASAFTGVFVIALLVRRSSRDRDDALIPEWPSTSRG